MTNSFKSAVSDIPLFHLAQSLSHYNTPWVLVMVCPTIPGFYFSFFPAALCWTGSLEWLSQIVSLVTLLCLPQRIHVNAQSACKTLTRHNHLLSRRKSKSQGMEAGIQFASDSPLNCALAARSEPSLGAHQAHVLWRARGSSADPRCCCWEFAWPRRVTQLGASPRLPEGSARSSVLAADFHDQIPCPARHVQLPHSIIRGWGAPQGHRWALWVSATL